MVVNFLGNKKMRPFAAQLYLCTAYQLPACLLCFMQHRGYLIVADLKDFVHQEGRTRLRRELLEQYQVCHRHFISALIDFLGCRWRSHHLKVGQP